MRVLHLVAAPKNISEMTVVIVHLSWHQGNGIAMANHVVAGSDVSFFR